MGVISEEEAGAPFASTTFSTPAVYEPQATNDEEFHSWADAIPQAAGLYDPREEKDACGVGFLVQIKGVPSHKILAEGKFLLCNMTHRGAVGADARDGDGAGVMCGIPHDFYASQVESAFRVKLPPKGQYAVGNLFFKPERSVRQECKEKFEEIAESLGLTIMCWRPVPRDNSILGPASKSKEPVVEQPFVTVANQDPKAEFDYAKFEHTLYLLRKQSIHAIGFKKWYYICSLSNKNIIYKGLLSPVQVYSYFKDLTEPEFKTHFALVHSRFSTNTFPSWDRAQPMRWCAHNGL
jgi:glutamate synthase (NADPH/NADH)